MENQNPIVNINSPARRQFRKVEDDSNVMAFGRVQPQAIQLEEAVLGAIMIDKDALPVVINILKPESFYKPQHQLIYRSMLNLFEKTQPIDLLTVHESLKKTGELENAGGIHYLVDLSNRVGSAANIEYHARIIAQKHIQRELIRIGTSTVSGAFDETMDVFDLLDETERNLYDVTQGNLNRGYETLGGLAAKAQKHLEEISQREEGLTGVPSGFTALDRLTSGWQSSDLIIVAARPGMGKTSFTLALARNAAFDHNMPIAIFSLEMASQQLVTRLMSLEAEIEGSKMRSGRLDQAEWAKMHTVIERMSEVPIYIDDTPGINIFELRAKCRRLKMHHGIKMVIIDYLQLMSGRSDNKTGNREQEISSISRSLKGLAKELEIPVIAISQLSRAVETRGGAKRPMLSDLRESGAIEQDADIVSFIYRPDYYEMESSDESSPKGVVEIIIAKHRHGPLETIQLKFVDKFAKFTELDDFDFTRLRSEMPIPAQANYGSITRPSKMNDDDVPF
ncbi:MAG: replicative DNA helicase [Saprospiraceae bacterium]